MSGPGRTRSGKGYQKPYSDESPDEESDDGAPPLTPMGATGTDADMFFTPPNDHATVVEHMEAQLHTSAAHARARGEMCPDVERALDVIARTPDRTQKEQLIYDLNTRLNEKCNGYTTKDSCWTSGFCSWDETRTPPCQINEYATGRRDGGGGGTPSYLSKVFIF